MSTGDDEVTLFPGMAGVTRDMVSRLKTEGVDLFSVDIMVTQKCNFRCIYCYADGAPERTKQLTTAEAKAIVDDCVEMGVRVVNMQGGEPLIWHPPDWDGSSGEALFHLIGYVKDLFEEHAKPVNIVSFTDVGVMTRDKAQRLLDLGVSLCCKIDTLDEATQDTLLGREGGARKIKQGFQHLIDAGYGAGNSPPLSTNTVVTAINYDHVPNVFRWSRSHGFRPFVIPVHVHGRAKEHSASMLSGRSGGTTLDSGDIRGLFETLADIDGREFGIEWEAQSPWVENKACSRHLGGIHVRADGIVVPCSEAPDHWALGDIRKASLKDVVSSPAVQRFRQIYSQLHANSKCSPTQCPLSAESKCYGCRTRAYDDSGFGENGDFDPVRLDPEAFFAGDPACWRTARTEM